MAFLDNIQKNLMQGGNTAQQGAGLGQSLSANPQALQRLASQIQTGKAGTGLAAGDAELSNIQQQLAEQQTAAAAEQLQQEGTMEAAELGQQQEAAEMQVSQQEFETQERKLNLMQQYQQTLSTMLMEYEQSFAKLDARKQQAKLEQIGFLMRLADDKYITQLQINGRRARLENEYVFKENLQRAIFADELELLANNLMFRQLLNMDNREWKEQMQDIDVEFAIELAMAEAKSASTQAIVSGLGDTISAGAKFYNTMTTPKSDNDTTDTASTIKPITLNPGETK
ncbi:MAG: hypothetical protein QXD70_02030 [Candidatus Bathyarchaeia archaeon]